VLLWQTMGMSKPLVSIELWAIVAPLLLPELPKPKGDRPRVSDWACLTGIPWEHLPVMMGCGSGVTWWWRLRDWQAAGSGIASTGHCSTAAATPTASTAAGGSCAAGTSRSGSPGVTSTPASAWPGTAGSWSGRWPATAG
jgi:hypothetical protein